MFSGRQPLFNAAAAGRNSPALLVYQQAANFANALDALIVAGTGQFAAPANVQLLTSASGVTEVPAAHAAANAGESFPARLGSDLQGGLRIPR